MGQFGDALFDEEGGPGAAQTTPAGGESYGMAGQRRAREEQGGEDCEAGDHDGRAAMGQPGKTHLAGFPTVRHAGGVSGESCG